MNISSRLVLESRICHTAQTSSPNLLVTGGNYLNALYDTPFGGAAHFADAPSALDLIRRSDRAGGVNKRTLLMALTCPLSRHIMLDPVVCEVRHRQIRDSLLPDVVFFTHSIHVPHHSPLNARPQDGFSYERKAITNYLKKHQMSPVSGERLSSHTLLPNRLLLNMLRLHFPEALRRRSLPFFLQVPLAVVSLVFSFLPRQVCKHSVCACCFTFTVFLRDVPLTSSFFIPALWSGIVPHGGLLARNVCSRLRSGAVARSAGCRLWRLGCAPLLEWRVQFSY